MKSETTPIASPFIITSMGLVNQAIAFIRLFTTLTTFFPFQKLIAYRKLFLFTMLCRLLSLIWLNFSQAFTFFQNFNIILLYCFAIYSFGTFNWKISSPFEVKVLFLIVFINHSYHLSNDMSFLYFALSGPVGDFSNILLQALLSHT